jgi:hypothetical protein
MRVLIFLVLVLSGCDSPETATASRVEAVSAVLDDFHRAAADADEERYFAHFAEDGIFLGTDATERWDVESFRAYAHPHFAEGEAWTFRAIARNVFLSEDAKLAWFEEELETEGLGPARGSGVLRRDANVYRIVQYNLALTIPNERFAEIKELLASEAGNGSATAN